MGTFCCFEVTIGFGGNQRCDYVTYDTKGIWRFYEIKISKSDFKSKSGHTFLGNYNYYVMPKELYDQVKDEIPSDIGVYINGTYVKKKAKKKIIGVNEQVLKDSMIRSLYREAKKLIRSKDPSIVEGLERRLNTYKKECDEQKNRYSALIREVQEKYGVNWRRK